LVEQASLGFVNYLPDRLLPAHGKPLSGTKSLDQLRKSQDHLSKDHPITKSSISNPIPQDTVNDIQYVHSKDLPESASGPNLPNLTSTPTPELNILSPHIIPDSNSAPVTALSSSSYANSLTPQSAAYQDYTSGSTSRNAPSYTNSISPSSVAPTSPTTSTTNSRRPSQQPPPSFIVNTYPRPSSMSGKPAPASQESLSRITNLASTQTGKPALVLFDYVRTAEDEISVKEGEMVQVLENGNAFMLF